MPNATILQDSAGRRELADAETLFSAGRFSEAQERFQDLLQRAPGEPAVHARLGHLALLDNRPDAAVTHLAEALSLGRQSKHNWDLLAKAYYRRDELGSAAWCYDRLGRKGLAATLATMANLEPYRLEGGPGPWTIDWTRDAPLPLLAASVNGSPANLVLDTGAGDLVLDRDFAVAAGTRLGGGEERRFAGGRAAPVTYGHAAELGLPGLSLLDLPMQVLPLAPAFAGFFPGTPVHGILGTSVLSRFNVELDYPARRLRLTRKAPRGEAPKNAGERFWIAGSHYLVTRARLPGGGRCLMFLDSGMTGTAFACSASMQGQAGLSRRDGETMTGYGGGGEVQGLPVGLSSLCVGGACREDIPGLQLDAFPLETQFGFRIGGLVAQDFLRDRVLNLDFDSLRLDIGAGRGAPEGAREPARKP